MSLSGSYAPTNVSVTTTSGTLLASDKALQSVTLSNLDSANDVFIAVKPNDAVADKGIIVRAGTSVSLFGRECPVDGLNAISSAGTVTVAILRG